MDQNMSRQLVMKIHVNSPFSFKFVEYGFYVSLQNNAGHPSHNGHSQPFNTTVIPVLSLVLEDHGQGDILNVLKSTCRKVVGRTFICGKFGKFMNSLKIDYFYCKFKNTKDCTTNIASILNNFEKSQGISFTTLFDFPIKKTLSQKTKITNQHQHHIPHQIQKQYKQ